MQNLSTISTEELLARRNSAVKQISRLNNIQMAFKIMLNSAYGALG